MNPAAPSGDYDGVALNPSRALALFLSGAAPLAAAACGRELVALTAANDLRCPSSKLEVTHLEDGRSRVSGCGRMAFYFCELDVRGIEFCFREKPNPRAEVQKIAAADFGCPRDQIAIDDRGPSEFEASGCHRREVYRCQPPAEQPRCARVPGEIPSPGASGSAAPEGVTAPAGSSPAPNGSASPAR